MSTPPLWVSVFICDPAIGECVCIALASPLWLLPRAVLVLALEPCGYSFAQRGPLAPQMRGPFLGVGGKAALLSPTSSLQRSQGIPLGQYQLWGMERHSFTKGFLPDSAPSPRSHPSSGRPGLAWSLANHFLSTSTPTSTSAPHPTPSRSPGREEGGWTPLEFPYDEAIPLRFVGTLLFWALVSLQLT